MERSVKLVIRNTAATPQPTSTGICVTSKPVPRGTYGVKVHSAPEESDAPRNGPAGTAMSPSAVHPYLHMLRSDNVNHRHLAIVCLRELVGPAVRSPFWMGTSLTDVVGDTEYGAQYVLLMVRLLADRSTSVVAETLHTLSLLVDGGNELQWYLAGEQTQLSDALPLRCYYGGVTLVGLGAIDGEGDTIDSAGGAEPPLVTSYGTIAELNSLVKCDLVEAMHCVDLPPLLAGAMRSVPPVGAREQCLALSMLTCLAMHGTNASVAVMALLPAEVLDGITDPTAVLHALRLGYVASKASASVCKDVWGALAVPDRMAELRHSADVAVVALAMARVAASHGLPAAEFGGALEALVLPLASSHADVFRLMCSLAGAHTPVATREALWALVRVHGVCAALLWNTSLTCPSAVSTADLARGVLRSFTPEDLASWALWRVLHIPDEDTALMDTHLALAAADPHNPAAVKFALPSSLRDFAVWSPDNVTWWPPAAPETLYRPEVLMHCVNALRGSPEVRTICQHIAQSFALCDVTLYRHFTMRQRRVLNYIVRSEVAFLNACRKECGGSVRLSLGLSYLMQPSDGATMMGLVADLVPGDAFPALHRYFVSTVPLDSSASQFLRYRRGGLEPQLVWPYLPLMDTALLTDPAGRDTIRQWAAWMCGLDALHALGAHSAFYRTMLLMQHSPRWGPEEHPTFRPLYDSFLAEAPNNTRRDVTDAFLQTVCGALHEKGLDEDIAAVLLRLVPLVPEPHMLIVVRMMCHFPQLGDCPPTEPSHTPMYSAQTASELLALAHEVPRHYRVRGIGAWMAATLRRHVEDTSLDSFRWGVVREDFRALK